MKRILALILAAALCLGISGCGGEQFGSYTVLEELGIKEYATIYRSEDVIAPVVEAAMDTLAATGVLGRICSTWLGSDIILTEGNANAFTAHIQCHNSHIRYLLLFVQIAANQLFYQLVPFQFANQAASIVVTCNVGWITGKNIAGKLVNRVIALFLQRHINRV